MTVSLPADKANGRFDISPIQTQPMNEAMQVASITAVGSIPAEESMPGFTARMYAMVMNVVIPAVISVFTSVLFCFSLNNLSSIVSQCLTALPSFCNDQN
jgi:hypothetical protein